MYPFEFVRHERHMVLIDKGVIMLIVITVVLIVVIGIVSACKKNRQGKESFKESNDKYGAYYPLYSREGVGDKSKSQIEEKSEIKPIVPQSFRRDANIVKEDSRREELSMSAAERMALAGRKLNGSKTSGENANQPNERIENNSEKRQLSTEEVKEIQIKLANAVSNLRNAVPFSFGSGVDATTLSYFEVIQDAKSPCDTPIARMGGKVLFGDLSRKNTLIGGTVGSGKSSLAKAVLMWLCLNNSPNEFMAVVYDSRMTEYACFASIPHLIVPVISNAPKCVRMISWLKSEVLKRQSEKYNNPSVSRPRVFCVLDDIASLGTYDGWQESLRVVLADGYRVGINVMIVTSNPSSSIIHTEYRVNLPLRVCFFMPASIGYRLILNDKPECKIENPGEVLINDTGRMSKGNALYISDEIIRNLSDVFSSIYGNKSLSSWNATDSQFGGSATDAVERYNKWVNSPQNDVNAVDPVFEEAVDIVLEQGGASTSMLQRKLRIAYSRAARLIDEMEDVGIIGPAEGSRPRRILITKQQWDERVTTVDEKW